MKSNTPYSALSPPNNPQINYGQELYDCSQGIVRLVTNFGSTFYKLPVDAFNTLSNITANVIKVSSTTADEWFIDALNLLLDAWVILGKYLK